MSSVETVKQLRDRTGAGILDCKAALQASGEDLEKAIDFLRKKGMASAAKRAGREAKEGLIVLGQESHRVAIVEANCETDFVARTDDFKDLTQLAIQEVFRQGDSGASSPKVTEKVSELSGKIGEKILVKRARLVESKNGSLFCYLHSNQKIGVVVELLTAKTESHRNADLADLGKNLAMQVAAANPICVTRSQMPTSILDREKAIYREEVKGKPENILEKIVQGKLDKFYQTTCLTEQPFIKDDKKSVKQLIEETAKKINDSIEVKQFVRFQLGEQPAA